MNKDSKWTLFSIWKETHSDALLMSVCLSHNILNLAHHIATFCLMFCLNPNVPLHLWLKRCHMNSSLKLQEITGDWFGPLAESHMYDHQLNTKPHTA